MVLAIGTELGETDTLLFGESLALSGKVIRIDIEAEQLTRNALPDVAICSDAGARACGRCSTRCPARRPTAAAERVARAARRGGRSTCAPDYRMHGRFLDAVAEALPGRGHRRRLDPAGLRRQPRLRAGRRRGPGSTPRPATARSATGCRRPSAPSSRGPTRPVVALIGDGGIQFTIGELATGGRARPARADPALEQPGLRRDQDVHGRPRHPADRRRHLHPRLPDHRPRLRLPRAAGRELRAARATRCARRCAPIGPTVIEIDDAAVRRLVMSLEALTDRPASLFVDGAFRAASGARPAERASIPRPAGRSPRSPAPTPADVEAAVAAAAPPSPSWARLSGAERAAFLRRIAGGLRARSADLVAAADAQQRQAARRGRDRRRRRRGHLRLLRRARRGARRPPGRAGADARRRPSPARPGSSRSGRSA